MPENRIDGDLRAFAIRKVIDDWTSLQEVARPATFWIAEHEQTSEPDSPISTPVVDGWLFDGRELRKRPISDVVAFLNLAAGYPHSTGRFDIGISGLAAITGTHEITFFWQFGGLHGKGYRCDFDGYEFHCTEAWRS